jgi:hypothetical protein
MSKLLDILSEYLARRKGLLPLVGIVFILLNFGLQLIAPGIWLATSNLCLHFGLILAIVGLMVARAL